MEMLYVKAPSFDICGILVCRPVLYRSIVHPITRKQLKNQTAVKEALQAQFKIMEWRLWNIITWPAAILAHAVLAIIWSTDWIYGMSLG